MNIVLTQYSTAYTIAASASRNTITTGRVYTLLYSNQLHYIAARVKPLTSSSLFAFET